MVFAEAEANTVTDELAARSSLREREQEPQKIELLERDSEPVPLKTDIPATTANEEEDVQVEISLSSEIGKSGEEESSVASEVVEESSEPMEKHELSSLIDLKPESEAAEDTAETAVLPSAPAEPEADISTSHSSTEEEPADSTEPTVSSIEVKSEDSLETQSIVAAETTTTTEHPPANDDVSIPEPELIPEETPEVVVASHEVATKVDEVDDKETIAPPVIDDISELPTIEASSVDETPGDQTQPEVVVEATVEAAEEVVTGEE